MTRPRHKGRRPRRKFDDYPISHEFAGAATATPEAFDVMGQFATDYGAKPYQATLSIPRFDLATIGSGTGTNRCSITLGFTVGPKTLDAADLDPVINPREFWWVRKYYVQNNSNPAGMLWAIQGMGGADAWKVKTRRTLKNLDDTLWVVVRPDFTGFTALDTVVDMHVGVLYA